MEPKRARLRQLLGIVDERAKPEIRSGELAAMLGNVEVRRVEWSVLRGVKGEGLLLNDDADAESAFIVIPDCGTTPEQMFGISPGVATDRQWAKCIAGRGKARVLVMALVDRREGALMPEGRKAKFSQREVLWRAGFEMGRTVLGYEVQKLLAAVDALYAARPGTQVRIIGTGEGGLIALLAAALDTRIFSVGVEGAFASSDSQWEWPIDRTVFGIQREFGMAEIAAMVRPRNFENRNRAWPQVTLTDAGGGAPGQLTGPDWAKINTVWKQYAELIGAPIPDEQPGELPRVVDMLARKFLVAVTTPSEQEQI